MLLRRIVEGYGTAYLVLLSTGYFTWCDTVILVTVRQGYNSTGVYKYILTFFVVYVRTELTLLYIYAIYMYIYR